MYCFVVDLCIGALVKEPTVGDTVVCTVETADVAGVVSTSVCGMLGLRLGTELDTGFKIGGMRYLYFKFCLDLNLFLFLF